MISQRRMAAAAATAAAAVLLTAHSALACSIDDFTADAKARCDTSTGTPKAAITVTDKDGSGTPADISVVLRMATGMEGPVVGTAHIAHPTAEGVSTTILVDWEQGYSWYVTVTAGDFHDQQLAVLPMSDDVPCEVPTTPAPPATPTGSTTPAAPASSSPSTDATSAAPVPAAATSGPAATSGATALAETGGGSHTGLIAASAAAIAAAGAGVLFAVRRRGATARH